MFYKHLISYKKDRITIQELAKVINEGIDLLKDYLKEEYKVNYKMVAFGKTEKLGNDLRSLSGDFSLGDEHFLKLDSTYFNNYKHIRQHLKYLNAFLALVDIIPYGRHQMGLLHYNRIVYGSTTLENALTDLGYGVGVGSIKIYYQ